MHMNLYWSCRLCFCSMIDTFCKVIDILFSIADQCTKWIPSPREQPNNKCKRGGYYSFLFTWHNYFLYQFHSIIKLFSLMYYDELGVIMHACPPTLFVSSISYSFWPWEITPILFLSEYSVCQKLCWSSLHYCAVIFT